MWARVRRWTIRSHSFTCALTLCGIHVTHTRHMLTFIVAAEMKYMREHAKRLRAQVLDRQKRDAMSPSLSSALMQLTRTDPVTNDVNELRNAIIVELAKLSAGSVEALQLMSNQELVSLVRGCDGSQGAMHEGGVRVVHVEAMQQFA